MNFYIRDPIYLESVVRITKLFIDQYEDTETKDAIYESADGILTYVKKVKTGYSIRQWRQK